MGCAMAHRPRMARHGATGDGRSEQRLGYTGRSGAGHAVDTFDTVPPYVPPRIDDGRLYGRGACDAKGIAAAMLAAGDRLVQAGEPRVGLLFVVGEEEGSDGARAANQLPTNSRYLINGEPTESRMASGAKGSLRIVVRTTGREAHSAYPSLGRSAIAPLVALLARLPSILAALRPGTWGDDDQHRHRARWLGRQRRPGPGGS